MRTTARKAQILFDSTRDGHWEIYIMNPDGSDQRRLTYTARSGRHSFRPAWSPDRLRIAFASNRDGPWEIYVMFVDGSALTRLTHSPSEKWRNSNPDWAPDGKKLAFDSNRDGNWEIYVMDADGFGCTRLTTTLGEDRASTNPDWSPDGTRIAFQSDRDREAGGWKLADLYVMDADGSAPTRLTYSDGLVSCWTPIRSPDGWRLVFSSNRDGGWDEFQHNDYEIYVMDADGSQVQRLTWNEEGEARPHWSPDGTQIAFQSARFYQPGDWNRSEIFVMHADGSARVRLTFNEHLDGHPAW